ncbi:unnamed protein product [Paramecium sonneborni]|uniref:HSF-type DNA-binding domain-containing protein n=1 Tax=Paramecium sonneborni TaxID=65129 RepID=A0A8S1M0N7_9CILI|nr:unnamed protein product [Paramecium sonneborni]
MQNQSLQNIIRKNEENNGFIIVNQKEFLEKILFQYYKSKTFASFRRSLNSYGFQVYQLQNGQKLFINKNIISINQNIHKRNLNPPFQNYYQLIESEHQILLLQLTQIKKNQQLMEQNIKRVLSLQEEITRKMKLTMIQYIQGLLDGFIKGKKAEQFVLQFCFSIKNKQFSNIFETIRKIYEGQFQKSLIITRYQLLSII